MQRPVDKTKSYEILEYPINYASRKKASAGDNLFGKEEERPFIKTRGTKKYGFSPDNREPINNLRTMQYQR